MIRGSAINLDGASNGITAPSSTSQESLLCRVYEQFGIQPENVQMIEAHGTGTKLGDPIECEALVRAFQQYTQKQSYCALGSIKSNLGHAVTAAGIAGFLKVVLSLKNKQIPPSINFQSINPNIRLDHTPFYINTELKNWEPQENFKRIAGLSSFGLSGTNAHMIIEEAPELSRKHTIEPAYMVVLSAMTRPQLKIQVKQLSDHCKTKPDIDCGNISYTLLMGRKHLKYRLSCIAQNTDNLITLLDKWLETEDVTNVTVAKVQKENIKSHHAFMEMGEQCLKKLANASHSAEYIDHLSTISDLFTQGYDLNFSTLFSNEYAIISLPVYLFAKKQFWLKHASIQQKSPDR